MCDRRTRWLTLGAFLFLGAVWATGPTRTGAVMAGEKKQEAKEPEKRSGTVVGVVAGKGEAYVEVKADGEAKARKYVPHWVGGAPAQGGGPDKAMVKTIRELKVGSRVRLDWVFEERPRVVRIEVLRPAERKGDAK